jgi:hypothetical protein
MLGVSGSAKRYLDKDKGSGLTRRLHEARRNTSEPVLKFLLRFEPLIPVNSKILSGLEGLCS